MPQLQLTTKQTSFATKHLMITVKQLGVATGILKSEYCQPLNLKKSQAAGNGVRQAELVQRNLLRALCRPDNAAGVETQKKQLSIGCFFVGLQGFEP